MIQAVLAPVLRITAVLALPFALCAWIFGLLLGRQAGVACLASVLIYPAAALAHEAAHVVTYQLLRQPGTSPPRPLARRWTVVIERSALPRRHDIAVTLAGPAVGIVVCLAPITAAWALGAADATLLALSGATMFVLLHIASLLPGNPDFAALIAALQPTPDASPRAGHSPKEDSP